MKLSIKLNPFARRSPRQHASGSSHGRWSRLDTPESVHRASRPGLVSNRSEQWREGELPRVHDVQQSLDRNPGLENNIPADQLYGSPPDPDRMPPPSPCLTGTTAGLNAFPSPPPSITPSPSVTPFHSRPPSRSATPTRSVPGQGDEPEIAFPPPTYDGKTHPSKNRNEGTAETPSPERHNETPAGDEGTPLVNDGHHRTGKQCCHSISLQRGWEASKASFRKHIDPKTILENVDIREWFWPYSHAKYLSLLGVAMLVAVIVLSELQFHWMEEAMEITRKNMLPVLVVVVGLEPTMVVIALLIARVPDASHVTNSRGGDRASDDAGHLENQLSKFEKSSHTTALVIPCHNSDEAALKRVFESAYPHFRPQDIIVVDNGRSRYPPSSGFRQFVRSCHPEIVYVWSPIGSKNAAQLVGALAAKNHNYIMTIDDDVVLPPNFYPPIDRINDKVKAVAFPICGVDAHGRSPMCMAAWQDCEYKVAGLFKAAESAVCGVLFPHGAGWFCEKQTLIELMSNYHNLDFIADDVNSGIGLQKMKKLIALDASIVLETEVPTTIFGTGLNWWKQRKNSWEMGRHGRLMSFLGRIFLSRNGQTTLQGMIMQKFVLGYSIGSIIVDWVRVPVLVTMGGNLLFWRQAGLLTLAAILPLLAFKYITARKRPDLQPQFWAALTYPIYKQLYALVSICGAIRCVLFFMGGHKKPLNVREMIKNNDDRIFWRDPRFESNPGWLADEGEEIENAEKMAKSAQLDGGRSECDSPTNGL